MNDPLVSGLIEVINEEVRAFHRLLNSLQEEQRVIVEDDLQGIEQAVAAQRELAIHAHQLEVRRIQLVAELAGQARQARCLASLVLVLALRTRLTRF